MGIGRFHAGRSRFCCGSEGKVEAPMNVVAACWCSALSLLSNLHLRSKKRQSLKQNSRGKGRRGINDAKDLNTFGQPRGRQEKQKEIRASHSTNLSGAQGTVGRPVAASPLFCRRCTEYHARICPHQQLSRLCASTAPLLFLGPTAPAPSLCAGYHGMNGMDRDLCS